MKKMDRYLITCLAEECGEVLELLYTNKLKKNLVEEEIFEINDLLGVANLINKKDIIKLELNSLLKDEDEYNKIINKKEKLRDILNNKINKLQYLLFKSLRFGLENKYKEELNNKKQIEIKFQEIISILNILDKDIIKEDMWEKKEEKVMYFFNNYNKDVKKTITYKLNKFMVESFTDLKVDDLNKYEATVIQGLIIVFILVLLN